MDSLCHVRNNVRYVLWWRTVYVIPRVLFWCATRAINSKITLSWAHKPFATRLHMLFYILCIDVVYVYHWLHLRISMVSLRSLWAYQFTGNWTYKPMHDRANGRILWHFYMLTRYTVPIFLCNNGIQKSSIIGDGCHDNCNCMKNAISMPFVGSS